MDATNNAGVKETAAYVSGLDPEFQSALFAIANVGADPNDPHPAKRAVEVMKDPMRASAVLALMLRGTAPRRGRRGRPKGSTNKPKEAANEG
jgi:hypothetical protein